MSIRVSLAELAASRITFSPSEVAAIVLEICRQCALGALRGIPSAQVIRLTADGRVVAEGPVNTDPSDVVRAAHLLNELLPIDAHGGGRCRAACGS